MKTTDLSFYDPSNVGDRFQGPTVESISIDSVSGDVAIRLSNGVVSGLGPVVPFPVRNVTDAAVVDGDLIIYFDDTSYVNVGNVLLEYNYQTPTFTGMGVRVSDSEFKPLTSVDENIVITQTSDGLFIDITAPAVEEKEDAQGTIDYEISTLFRDNLGTTFPASVASIVNGYVNRNITSVAHNKTGITVVDGNYVLLPGTYYIDAQFSVNVCLYSYAELIDVATETVVMQSTALSSTTTASAVRYLSMRGAVSFSETTTLRLRQYTQTANSAGLYNVTSAPLGVMDYISSSYIQFYKTRNAETELNVGQRYPSEDPAICAEIKAFVDQYRERTPTVKRAFFEANTTSNYFGVVYKEPYAYFISSNSPYHVLRWDITNDTFKRITLESNASSLPWISIINVGDVLYLLPYNDNRVVKININTLEVLYLTVPGVIVNGGSWLKGVLAPNRNKIYAPPATNSNWLVVDVETDEITTTDFGVALGTTVNKFLGCQLTSDGKIYATPFSATTILVLDPSTETVLSTTMGVSLTGASKWYGSAYDPVNNKIFTAPCDATDVLVIDCTNNTAVRTAMGVSLSGTNKWIETIYYKDGLINVLPGANRNQLLQIDTQTLTATLKTIPHTTINFANGGVLVGDRYYLAPRAYADSMVYFDHTTESMVFVDHGRVPVTISSATRWLGLAKGPRGIVYTVPHSIHDCYSIDTASDRLGKINWPNEVSAGGYHGGGLAADGNVYLGPLTTTEFARIIPPTLEGTPNRPTDLWTYVPSRIPALTSNSQDGYVLTGSGVFSATYDYYTAFRGSRLGPTDAAASHGYASNARGFDGANPHWLQIELPVAEKFDYFQYRLGNNHYPWAVGLKGSVDGTNWIRLLTFTDYSHYAYAWVKPRAITNPTAFKFYRIEFYTSATVDTAAVSVIKFFNESDLVTPYYEINPSSTYDNHASGILTADSVYSTSYPLRNVSSDFYPYATGHCWATTNTALPHWIEFRRFTKFNVTALRLVNGYNHFPRAFRIDATNDGTNYTTLATYSELGNATIYYEHDLFEFENTESYYAYRVVFTESYSVNYLAIGTLKLLTRDPIDTGNPYGRAEWIPELKTFSTNQRLSHPTLNPDDGKLYFAPNRNLGWASLDTTKMELQYTTHRPIAERTDVANSTYDVAISPFNNRLFANKYAGNGSVVEAGITAPQLPALLPFEVFNESSMTVGRATIDEYGVTWSASFNATNTIHYDGKVGGFYSDYGSTQYVGTGKYGGAVLGPNGKIYLVTHNSNHTLEIDPTTKVSTQIPNLYTSAGAYEGGVLTKNGNILIGGRNGGTAANVGGFYVLDFGEGIEVPDSLLESPYIP